MANGTSTGRSLQNSDPKAAHQDPDPERVTERAGGRHRVMFVDDEANVLAGLRRLLHSMNDSWDMLFVASGAEALKVLEHQHFDAIVSDMRMPGMNGAELLARVQDLYPSTARLVLSGQGDPDTVLDLVRSAQQFLAKPCDARMLTAAVGQALAIQRTLSDPGLRSLIGGVTALPTLPAIYDQLVAAASSEDVDLSQIGAIVASDVSTSVEMLKLVNSAFFGLPREVYSVTDAVRLLGLDNVQALVLTSSLFRVNEALSWILDIEDMRDQSLRRAALARAIARLEGWTARAQEVAVLSCMLRDVGRLVLTEGRPDAAGQLHRALENERCHRRQNASHSWRLTRTAAPFPRPARTCSGCGASHPSSCTPSPVSP